MFTARTTTVTTAGTAVQLFDTANSYADSIRIKALSTNTGLVYIGMSDVDSTKGFALVKGEEITLTEDKNITLYYVDSDENGDKITWTAEIHTDPAERPSSE